MSDWMSAYEDEIADLLRTYEQDVRERIAQAIEARVEEGAGRASFWRLGHTTGIREAARIAREGGD